LGAPPKPNVVFILADDMGWGDLHCYGHPYAKTPNIDKLAAEGTRFQQFYATGVTCCPSRTGFMTSWLPARYPTYPANGGFAERVTITELLHKGEQELPLDGKDIWLVILQGAKTPHEEILLMGSRPGQSAKR
jgi:hypothetical protein